MRIAKTQINLEYNAYEIYISGCNQTCEGCHNPSLKDFNEGVHWKECIERIIYDITDMGWVYDQVWLLGGEPMDNDINELFLFVSFLHRQKKEYDFDIVLFTSHDMNVFDEGLPENTLRRRLRQKLDYVKIGKYDNTQLSDSYREPILNIKLASTNQKVVSLKNTSITDMYTPEGSLIQPHTQRNTFEIRKPDDNTVIIIFEQND